MPDKFEVRDPEVEALLRGLARELHGCMPNGFGFCLFIASIGEGGGTFYISDCKREDMIGMVKEWLELQEGSGAGQQ